MITGRACARFATSTASCLISDEVMSGWGRTGEWFAVDNWNVVPDIITTAKGITSGYVPLGAVIVSREDCQILR
ncbi:MAG: aminotransferase class III-fold pyridoxal phosphate-dependent enzyme [Desulfobacterales bacterium]|nr:aminotransferase class III-fold pyridoxal phosphate-dependent enzyme [Desulfobacterales bacterium]